MIAIEELKKALACADEAYLTGMSNKGLYKRACKDIDGAQVDVAYEGNTASVTLCGETCTITEPLWDSKCTCPSRSICRHIIGAILWLKENLGDAEEPDEESPEPPAQIGAELTAALQVITPNALKRALGRELAKTVEDVQNGRITLNESSVLSAQLPDGTAVRLLYPLEFSTCACHRKELCSHKAAAVLAWQSARGLVQPTEFLVQSKTLTKAETAKIHDISAQAQAVLMETAEYGLVRMPDNLPEHLEVAALQCHSAKLADAERLLRDLGSRLEACRARRASFSPADFLFRFARCAACLADLQAPTLTEEALGAFRNTYTAYKGDLRLLPIGIRSMRGGDYEGEVYFFLNLDNSAEERFLSLSDLRPVFYESVRKMPAASRTVPWNLNMPLRAAMKREMVLQNAKLCGGKLSASQETFVAGTTNANLDCKAVHELIYSDFCKLAVDIAEKQPETELQRMCFLYPHTCVECGFDKHSQQYRMVLADAAGHHITVRAKHRAETKEFIEQLERIGSGMTAHPEKTYVLLCTAYFENGELCLFPIEFYDFIRVPQTAAYTLPERYAPAQTRFAGALLEVLQAVQDWLCEVLQSGLRSVCDVRTGRELAERAEQCGLQGLAQRLTAFTQSTEHDRHSMTNERSETLRCMTEIVQYLQTGRQKLEALSAIHRMGGTTTCSTQTITN